MHETALAHAARPERVAVLGLLLEPYSLGHELLLIRESNPLVVGGVPKPTDLASAVLICCQGWQANSRIGADRLLPLKKAIWHWRTRKCFFGVEQAKFRAYRENGSMEFPMPEIFEPGEKPGRPPGSPLLLRLHLFLTARLGLAESAAWDYPLGLAKMRWQCYWEEEGGLKVQNHNEAAFDNFIAEQEGQCRA